MLVVAPDADRADRVAVLRHRQHHPGQRLATAHDLGELGQHPLLGGPCFDIVLP